MNQFNTKTLYIITGFIGGIAWILTFAVGRVLYDYFTLPILVVVISLGSLLVTTKTAVYMKYNTSDHLANITVWKIWLGLSVLGCLINIFAGLMVEYNLLFVFESSDIIETAPMQYGVVLPWVLIYTVGYAFTGLYNWDVKSVSKRERGVYIGIGMVSSILAVVLLFNPHLFTEMIYALAVLTFIQAVVIFERDPSLLPFK